ncbi:MAG: hypothetical protein RBT73_09580 [Spirochaetia bacterium]|jgi:hypothetical protein|nr:hypothetical protein [Spirochaetia bacterium]
MKKSALMLFAVIGLAICSCSHYGPKTGDLEGFEIYFSTNPDNIKAIASGRDVSSAQAKGTYYPRNGALGFTKFWFPGLETYNALKTKGSFANGVVPLQATDLAGLSFYKAIDRSNDNPLILDAASGVPYSPEIDLPYGALYKGLVIEYVFLQIEMDDYRLRYYTQDSNQDNKGYKPGDVLIDLKSDNEGWKYLYNKRVFTFDYNYKDHQFPSHTYERIENCECEIGLFLSAERRPAAIYYENWKYQGGITGETPSYIEDYLRKNDLARLNTYESDSTKLYEDQTLVQIFRPNPDVPIDGSGGSFTAEKGEDTYLRNKALGTGHGPSGNPTLIVNYGPNATLDKPYTIETFADDANEAKLYKLELVYSLGNSDHGTDGLTIQVPVDGWDDTDTPSPAWGELSAFNKFLSIGPSCGGIGARFGWLDFNDEWQGEFSAGAGH